LELRPEFKKKSIRSYVVRGGRMTEGQRAAFAKWWPKYGLNMCDGALDYSQCFGRKAPLVLEIGFGMGDSLLAMAQVEQDKDFIGIDVHPPGVGRLINTAGKEAADNLRVYCADAVDVLDDCIADNSLARVQLYFPDPWHKKKHHKRRILQPALVQKIRTKLTLGGLFHMATDWENYAEHMMEVMDAAEGFENNEGVGNFAPRPDFRPVTKFEKRGERLGHDVWDLIYKKVTG
jgi:tRNA (guanine-N7-)-methyltransferase